MANQAKQFLPMYEVADRSAEVRARALPRIVVEREWLPLLASLPLAIASFDNASQIVAIVAKGLAPQLAEAIAVDRLESDGVRREHAYGVHGVEPLAADDEVIERVLRRGRSEVSGSTLVIAVPSARTPRAISLRSSTGYTDQDAAHAEVLAQWLAFALSTLDAEPAIDAIHAAAVHDLMNPLSVIVANAKGLRNQERSRVDERLALIERSANRMRAIAVDLLDNVRRATDRVSLELSWLYVGDLFDDALDSVRDVARAKEIRIHVEECDGLVLCDRTRIVQVLVNLLDNALKYTHRGGEVSFKAERIGGKIRITVADNGRGIAASHLPRLFDRYWRSSPGTGIGLATARAFTAAHDSELQVTSVLGAGSTFWFDLHSAE